MPAGLPPGLMPNAGLGGDVPDTAQLVLALADVADRVVKDGKPRHPTPFILPHMLYLLPILAVLSAVGLLLTYILPPLWNRLLILFGTRQAIFLGDDEDDDAEAERINARPLRPSQGVPSQGYWSDLKGHISLLRLHGTVIIVLEVLRLVLLGALVGLTIYAAFQAEPPKKRRGGGGADAPKGRTGLDPSKKKKKNKSTVDDYSSLEWGEFGASLFYAYNLLFSFILLTNRPPRLHRRLTAHVDILLLLASCLFVYRDIWPSLTYYLIPRDINNWVTWTRIGILGFIAIAIPLLRPRTYVPADSSFPTPPEDIAPEQIAPPLFYVFHTFMTGLVFKAWRTQALPYDDLQPIADYDRAQILYNKHMGNMDPLRRQQRGLENRHLFWNIIYGFRWEIFASSVLCLFAAVLDVIPSIALNQLLGYFQTDGANARIRPIVWVALLFLGPTAASLSIQFYLFIMTRCLVRAEAVLTQLLFDHALRLRVTLQPEEPRESWMTTETEMESQSPDGSGFTIPPKFTKESPAKTQGDLGNINNLMASEVESVVEGRDLPLLAVYLPVQLALCITVLYCVLSWSSLVGTAAMIITIPIPGLLARKASHIQGGRVDATDSRRDAVVEFFGALRMIKMFGWEESVKARIADHREKETALIRRGRVMNLWVCLLGFADASPNNIVNMILPVITMAAALASYTILQKKTLDAATVFTALSVFELLRGQLGLAVSMVRGLVTAAPSLKRLDFFLRQSDLVDSFTRGLASPTAATVAKSHSHQKAEAKGQIRLSGATFVWDSNPDNLGHFRLHVPKVKFAIGKINLITGPPGSGKTTFLKALLGELHFKPNDESSFYHLPREGGVSYAPQEGWCLPATVKENILFGQPYDGERYDRVVHDCALQDDLKLFEDGDETEIGEKGVTLLSDQTARITLARAMYANSAIVLLDDVFASQDPPTARFIVDNLFKGVLVKDRTIVLATHHLRLISHIASYMVTMDENGTVESAGDIDQETSPGCSTPDSCEASPDSSDASTVIDRTRSMFGLRHRGSDGAKALLALAHKGSDGAKAMLALAHHSKYSMLSRPAAKFCKHSHGRKKHSHDHETPASDAPLSRPVGKPAMAEPEPEEKPEGRISLRALAFFFSNFGGAYFWTIYFALLVLGQGLGAFQSLWLGWWAHAYEQATSPEQVSVSWWMGLYLAWASLSMLSISIAIGIYSLGSMKAARTIHARLVDCISGAYMRFLDRTPLSHIMSRFSKDMSVVDHPLTDTGDQLAQITIGLVVKLISAVVFVPWFSFPALLIGVLCGVIGELYIHAQISVRREMSDAKHDLLSHLGGVMSGMVSIRAYGAQDMIREQVWEKEDYYTRAATAFYNLNRWVTVRIDMLGGAFAALLAAVLVYWVRLPPYLAGFALWQAISFSAFIVWWVRLLNELEVQGNAMERIGECLVIDQEPAASDEMKPPAEWPTSGKIEIDGLSARYWDDGPVALDDISLSIKSGERIGVVGGPGSGKSTLALALLGMIPTTGTIAIDGVPTSEINLHDLRSQITVIPQNPDLLSDSVRYNLDPFDVEDDATLYDALRAVGLGPDEDGKGGLPLSYPIPSTGGSNIGQAECQLVLLASALVRKSKVVIFDDAANYSGTDERIHSCLRSLPSTTTVITVAHRLAPIVDYDRILVLGEGKALEFDAPDVLSGDPDSHFAHLIEAMEG